MELPACAIAERNFHCAPYRRWALGGGRMKSLRYSSAMLVVLTCGTHAALAQRAGDNAVASAQDAFGTSVGNENIGLYTASSARGFSPSQAGNLRIDGLYFDQQVNLGNRLVRSSTIRVGLSAQSYPFPAPTGIADYQLRLPGDQTVVSAVGTYITDGTYRLEVDSQLQLVPEKLSLSAGASGASDVFTSGATAETWTAGGMFRWRPNDNIEIVPFWARESKTNWESNTNRWFPAGAFLPPEVKRGVYVSQDWAQWAQYDTNFGILSRAKINGDWTLRAGLFRSLSNKAISFISFYRNIQPDASAELRIIANPPQSSGSYSGEVRASRVFVEGPRRHTLHFAVRGRETDRIFGGAETLDFGPVNLTTNIQFPKPAAFNYGPTSHDTVRQATGGITYEGLWSGVGEMSVGVQKTRLERTLDRPTFARANSNDSPWIYNGTLAMYPTKDLAFYASYTRGLEESGVAPENAVNYGQPQPSSITKQVDAGVRYAVTPNLRLVAGVFEVKKPYFNRNTANVYTTVGGNTNRGIELSFSGTLAPGLRMVAGGVFMRSRISGLTVDQGLIGRVPAGEAPRTLKLNLQYGPASWHGFSIDGEATNLGAMFADRLNTYKIPSDTSFDLGARYQFKLHSAPASVRVQITNLTNSYSWSLDGGSGTFRPTLQRRITTRFSVDL
jgi:iron complex outermembrane recepter protein